MKESPNGEPPEAGDIVGTVVIGGDGGGIAIQNIVTDSAPSPPLAPWRAFPPTVPTLNDLDIFNLLDWRTRLVEKLVGRDDDRRSLLDWAREDPRPIAIHFLTGHGGAGKSRLAAEVASELRAQGWSTGVVDPREPTLLPIARDGLLLVVDYSEERREAVGALLDGLDTLENPPAKLRLLLLSRRPLDAWLGELTVTGSRPRYDARETWIGYLGVADTRALVRVAAARLAEHLGTACPNLDDAAIATWYAQWPYAHGLPLFATAAAVHAVLTRDMAFTLGDTGDGKPATKMAGTAILENLVGYERQRLDEAAAAADWPKAEAASWVCALAALRGGFDEPALIHLARTAPDLGLPPPERVAGAVRALGRSKGSGIEAPRPNMMAAALLRRMLLERPGAMANWLAATLPTAETIDLGRLARLADDLATLYGEAMNLFATTLVAAVLGHPELAVAWRSILDSSATRLRLSAAGAAIGQTLLERGGLDDEERARVLHHFAVHLDRIGKGTEERTAREEAVAIHRRLADADPGRFEPGLATSLRELAGSLYGPWERPAALAATAEAVAILRRLSAAHPPRFEPELADSLIELSHLLHATGDMPATLAAIFDAIAIYRRMAEADPTRFAPPLAESLVAASEIHATARNQPANLAAISEAIAIHRRLAETHPIQFEPLLAKHLHNLSIDLGKGGDPTSALAAIEETVAIYRRLAEANPARFEPDLAQSLGVQKWLQGQAGQ